MTCKWGLYKIRSCKNNKQCKKKAAGKRFGCRHLVDKPPNPKKSFFTWCLVVVDIYPLQLQVTVSLVTTGGVDAMFITYHLPELRWDKRDDISDKTMRENQLCVGIKPSTISAHLVWWQGDTQPLGHSWTAPCAHICTQWIIHLKSNERFICIRPGDADLII